MRVKRRVKRKESKYVVDKLRYKFSVGDVSIDYEDYHGYFQKVVFADDVESDLYDWIKALKKYNRKAEKFDEGLLDDKRRKKSIFLK